MSDFPATIGRYHIVKRLGRGGMGVVYLARDPVIGRDVAVKVLRTLDESDLRERFAREIQIAGALAHPNIVRIYDAGEFDEQPFIAMEFVPGPTLDHYIRSGLPVPLDRKLEMLSDLADGLAHAHARNVVHRDIKPSNLIIDDHNRLKILDFGIARFAASGNVSLVAVGTPSYMAPEQIRGEAVDQRCDIFSAGVVAYELLAYRKPFVAENHSAVHQQILTDAPLPLQAHDHRLPRAVSDIIEVALQKRPQDRFPTAQALGDALRHARANLTVDESTVVTIASAPSASAAGSIARPSTSASPAPSPSPKGGKRSQRVAEVRQRLLESAKDAARQALAEGHAEAAVQAAEQALAVDDGDAEAAELLEQARLAVDHSEAQRLLAQARAQEAAGALVSARQTLESARAAWPDAPEIEQLDRRIALQIREREEQVQRAREGAAAVARARVALAAGDLGRAQAAIAEALARDSANPEALEVHDLVQARVEDAAARARWEAQVEASCRTAEAEFAQGAQLEALHRLEAVSPAHPRVTALLTELRAKRRAALDEQRRLAARQLVVDRALEAARTALKARDASGAVAALSGLDGDSVASDAVRRVLDDAEALRLALEKEGSQRRAAGIAAARDAVARGDVAGARRALDDLVAAGLAGAEVDEAFGTVAKAEEAAEHRRRRAATLQAGLADVRAAAADRDPLRAANALKALVDQSFSEAELAPGHAVVDELEAARVRESRLDTTYAEFAQAVDREDLTRATELLRAIEEDRAPARRLDEARRQVTALALALEELQRREKDSQDERAKQAQGLDQTSGSRETPTVVVPTWSDPGRAPIPTPAVVTPPPIGKRRSLVPMTAAVVVAAGLAIFGTWAALRGGGTPSAVSEGPRAVDGSSAPPQPVTPEPAPAPIAAGREADVLNRLASARTEAEAGRVDAALERLRGVEPPDGRIEQLRRDLEALRAQNLGAAAAQALVGRLDVALRRGDLTTASAVASETLQRFPTAPGLAEHLRRLAQAAGQESQAARAAASRYETTPLFAEAARTESRANQLLSKDPHEAFKQYRLAAEAFGRAAQQAETSVVDNRPSPTPPVPAPAPPTPAPPPIDTRPREEPVDPARNRPPEAERSRPAEESRGYTAETAQTEILQLVRAYEAAYSAMDEATLRELQLGFKGITRKDLIRSVRLTISNVQIAVASDLTSARVVGSATYRYEWRRAGLPAEPPTSSIAWTATRTARGWRLQ